MSIASVIASVVATQVFGGVWFTLLSEPWMRGLGKKHKDFKNMGHTSLVLSGIAMFALSVFMSNTLRPFFGVQTVEEAIHFALRVSVAGALLQIPHNTYEGKGWSTYLVNIGYDTICLLITCVLTVVM
ncbi:uncharacterized protein [Asterias amurensis]|uniref:uncharacterized protein n=1 Tax=Asterias amurensis TaxID=7602 RepID=UPI003AB46151